MLKNRGFTLLEILVVIGIIGVLVGLGASSYSTAQKKARDARRKSDLKALQNCMEQNYAVNSFLYQDIGNAGDTIDTGDSIDCGGGKTIQIVDPLNNTTYKYVVGANGSDTTLYQVSTTLEGSGTFEVQNLQ